MNTQKKDLDLNLLKCYMLRNKNNNLYWCGGGSMTCNKNGKVWRKLNHLRCAISQHNQLAHDNGFHDNILLEKDYEIIELSYSLSGGEVNSYIPFVKE